MEEKSGRIYKFFYHHAVETIYVILVFSLGIYTFFASHHYLFTSVLLGIFMGSMMMAKFYTRTKLYRYLLAGLAFLSYVNAVEINQITYLYQIAFSKWSILLFCYILLIEDYIIPIAVGIYPSIRMLMLLPEALEGKYPVAQVLGPANGQFCLTIMSVAIYRLFSKLIIERDKFRKMSITDSLTGVATFAHTIETAKKMLQNGNISVLLTDMDHFKQINDTYGHVAGNKVLVEIAEFIKQETEGLEAVIGRLGGDEFVIVVRNDGSKRVLELGESILKSVRNKTFVIDPEMDAIVLSLSVGQANSSPMDNNIEKLLHRADVNMYYNKYKNNRLNFFLNMEKPVISREGLELLSVLAEKDMYTYVHSGYTAQYASALAKELHLSEEKVGQLYSAGWLHDIGKILISSEIVRKADKLSVEEYNQMKKHICYGLNILQSLNLPEDTVKCIQYHHEYWNGSGYPMGLNGNQVPIEARILQVADSYSAMIIKRVYRKTLTQEEAMNEILRNSGVQFDPEIVKVFYNMIRTKAEIA